MGTLFEARSKQVTDMRPVEANLAAKSAMSTEKNTIPAGAVMVGHTQKIR